MPLAYEDLKLTREEDHKVVATALNGHVRLLALNASKSIEHLRKVHDLSPISTAVAGRLAMMSLLLADGLKQKEAKVHLTLKCEGPIQSVQMTAQADGSFRGSVRHPHTENLYDEKKHLNMKKAIGEGYLQVQKDLGLRERYTGQVELVDADLAQSFSYYLAQSEQISSFVSLGLSFSSEGVKHAGALLVQVMPDITEEELSYLEKRAQGGFPDLSYLMEEGFSPAQIMDLFMGDPDIFYLDSKEIFYHCPCSKVGMSEKLMTLGKKDLEELSQDPMGIELQCSTCDARYYLNQREIKNLLSQLKD